MWNFKCRVKQENGAAAVEVAILSLVMVPMAIYAIFFFDLALINIKVSELSRYAAWELSAMQLSNFHEKNPDHAGNFESKVKLIKTEVEAIWGDDMTSGTRTNSETYGLFEKKVTGLTVSELDVSGGSAISEFSIVGTDNPYANDTVGSDSVSVEGTGFMQTVLDMVMDFMGGLASGAFRWFKFNTEGFSEVNVSVKLKFDRKVPIYGDDSMIISMPALKSSQKLLVDAWDLKDGGDVDWGQKGATSGGNNEGYYRQVDRMTFLGGKAKLQDFLGGVSTALNKFANFLNIRLPYETEVRSYALKNGNSASGNGCTSAERNIKGCVVLPMPKTSGMSGKDKNNYRRGGYYTNSLADVTNFTNNSDSPYFQIYKRQSPNGNTSTSGNIGYYMGCDKPEIVDRQDCWKN